MQQQIATILPCLLRPIVRFCVRHSVSLGALVEMLKEEFVIAAQRELIRRGEKQSGSRISVMTGVHRKDVTHLLAHPKGTPSLPLYARVLGAWQQDHRFCSSSGHPRTLSVDGKQSEFATLVRSVSSDLNSYTVLAELLRIEAVQRTSRGLRLKTRAWSPRGDPVAGFRLLERDLRDLIGAVENNVLQPDSPLEHHGQTEYDNIPQEAVPEIRHWLMREGSALHQRARNFLSQFDRDVSKISGTGRVRVSIGSFSHVADTTTVGE